MPNAIVHYTFAKKFVQDCPDSLLEAAYVGAQGPDPYFFFGVVPKFGRSHAKTIRSLGGITQHDEIAPNYIAMIEYAKQSEDKDLLFAYIDGLFMHYAVDRACHPYIFWHTGYTDRPEDSEEIHHHYNFGHLMMEMLLDLIIGKEEGTFGCAANCIRLKEKDLRVISKMWYEVNKFHQKVPFIQPDSFAKCIHDYRSAARFAYSPLGIKRKLLGLVFGKRSFPYGFSSPMTLKGFESCDFLNEARSEWYMPDNSGPRKETFKELLYIQAKAIYEDCHRCILKAKEGKDYQEELIRVGAHINHEGIVPNSPKLTWKLIWPKDFMIDMMEPTIRH